MKPELTRPADDFEAVLAAAHLASLPTDYRAQLEREFEPPAPYVIAPERWAQLNSEWEYR